MNNTCIWTFMAVHDFNDEKKEAVVRFLKEAGVLDCFESAVRAWFDKEEAKAEAASEERLNGGQPVLDYRQAKAAIPVYTVDETRSITNGVAPVRTLVDVDMAMAEAAVLGRMSRSSSAHAKLEPWPTPDEEAAMTKKHDQCHPQQLQG